MRIEILAVSPPVFDESMAIDPCNPTPASDYGVASVHGAAGRWTQRRLGRPMVMSRNAERKLKLE